MSTEHNDSLNPAGNLIGIAFLVIVAGVLIVMMGIVGFAFLGGSGVERVADAEEETVEVAAVAPAPAAEEAGDTPPSESAPADGGEPEASGNADAAPAAEIDPAVMALGQTSYMTCAACHGTDGKGLQAGPALMAPSLVGSELLLGDPDKSLLVVLKGIAKKDMKYMGQMLSLAAALDDEKLAAVLTYTRNSWGNSAPAVTVEQAAQAREKFGAVDAPMGVDRDKIEEIVAAHK